MRRTGDGDTADGDGAMPWLGAGGNDGGMPRAMREATVMIAGEGSHAYGRPPRGMSHDGVPLDQDALPRGMSHDGTDEGDGG